MQRRFRIARAAGALALALVILGTQRLLDGVGDRKDQAPRAASLRLEPVDLGRSFDGPLRPAGAWSLSSDEPRFGGISALALDRGHLVAITDSGSVIRMPKPAAGEIRAVVSDLPAGPGRPNFKINRDSEAIAADPLGRGWWVAFENRDEIWLYDRQFGRALGRLKLPKSAGLRWNSGIEAIAFHDGRLLAVPEAGGRALEFGTGGTGEVPLPVRPVSEVAALSDRSLLLAVERKLGPAGFSNALVRLDRCGRAYCVVWRAALNLGALDNVEALAIEQLGGGKIRLWLMTDDNFNGPLRTLLVAADLRSGR